MARCPECNKFVSLALEAPEPNLDVDADSISGEIIFELSCSLCGVTLQEYTEDIVISIEDFKHRGNCDGEIIIQDISCDEIDYMKNKKHIYGANTTVLVACKKCKKEKEYTNKIEVLASDFEDCYY